MPNLATRPLPQQHSAPLIAVQVSGVSKEPPPVSEESPHFTKTQYPVYSGTVLMKQAQSTVNFNNIHDFLMRFIVFFLFFAYLPILSEPPICPRNMKLSRHGLKRHVKSRCILDIYDPSKQQKHKLHSQPLISSICRINKQHHLCTTLEPRSPE